jgi:hypothetical protein
MIRSLWGGELGLEAEKPFLVAGFHELMHESRSGLKSNGHPALTGCKINLV